MKYLNLLAAMALSASAFPFALEKMIEGEFLEAREFSDLAARQIGVPSTAAARAASRARGNCGVVPCLVFSATEQYVSTSGQNAYASPKADEIRGPCPGLNAAANHGYLSRSGVTTIQETVTGLGVLYGMSPELGGFLAAFAVLVDGDPIGGTWSIGGPQAAVVPALVKPQGISYSHNNYEGDVSIGREDAFLNNGDAHSLNTARFATAYASTSKAVSGASQGDRYTLDSFAQDYNLKLAYSILQNPYYVSAPFAGLVAPAAYNFVINFMSNHTAAEPSGYLDGTQFKTWFAITGAGTNASPFVWKRGQERIPNNWYRRTSTNQYNAANVFDDLGSQFAAYPQSFRLGGNTGKKNSYVGVDLSNFTGGVFTAQNLLQGNNLQCFFGEFAQAAIPDAAGQLLQAINAIRDQYLSNASPFFAGLDCPIVAKYDQTAFNKYPGYSYHPSGPAQNY